MTFKLVVTWDHIGPRSFKGPTIWEALATKLGRDPTREEAADEVRRILEECTIKAAGQGKLSWQRKRRNP